jgi:hypothetical protein
VRWAENWEESQSGQAEKSTGVQGIRTVFPYTFTGYEEIAHRRIEVKSGVFAPA